MSLNKRHGGELEALRSMLRDRCNALHVHVPPTRAPTPRLPTHGARCSDARRFDMEAALERASREKRSLESELER